MDFRKLFGIGKWGYRPRRPRLPNPTNQIQPVPLDSMQSAPFERYAYGRKMRPQSQSQQEQEKLNLEAHDYDVEKEQEQPQAEKQERQQGTDE
jgi:hypothetical protein